MEKCVLIIEDSSREYLKSVLLEMMETASNMRAAQKKWRTEYGAKNRNRMVYWEEKMDGLLTKYIQPKNQTEL